MDDGVVIVMVLVLMGILGAVMGSFACCQAWRWHYAASGKKKKLGKWSVCMSCKKRIMWYDNIPIISWLVLGGKCRYCGKKIGVADFLAEVVTAAGFVALSWKYLAPLLIDFRGLLLDPEFLRVELIIFALTLVMLVVLVILAVYDAKWGELPVVLLILAIGLGLVIAGLKVYQPTLDGGDMLGELVSTFMGVVILAGSCWMIYKVSHEKLMGGGDWMLALALALALANWWLALWTIFLASLLGDLVALPSALKRKKYVVHFGPFLVVAFVVVVSLSDYLFLLLGSS